MHEELGSLHVRPVRFKINCSPALKPHGARTIFIGTSTCLAKQEKARTPPITAPPMIMARFLLNQLGSGSFEVDV